MIVNPSSGLFISPQESFKLSLYPILVDYDFKSTVAQANYGLLLTARNSMHFWEAESFEIPYHTLGLLHNYVLTNDQ